MHAYQCFKMRIEAKRESMLKDVTDDRLIVRQLCRNFGDFLTSQFQSFVPDLPTPACSYVRYSSLEDVRPQELGFRQLEFTPTVVSKIR